MHLRHYEIVLFFHPNQSNQVAEMITRYKKMVADGGGAVHRDEDWGRRPLAYTIAKVHKAHYYLLNIECDQATLAELENTFRFNDAIIRSFILKRKEAITTPSKLAVDSNSSNKDSAARESRGGKFKSSNSRLRHTCEFTAKGIDHIDYKDLDLLKSYVMESWRMVPSRITNTSARYQRMLTKSIKIARYLALIPYCDTHK